MACGPRHRGGGGGFGSARAEEVDADGWTPPASESGAVGHREEVRRGERKEAGPD